MCSYYKVKGLFILLVLLLVSLKERYISCDHTEKEMEAERHWLQRDLLLELD